MHRTKETASLFLIVLLLRGGIACNEGDEKFREDVIACENAVAHVAACCPGVAAPEQACVYHYLRETVDCGCTAGDSVHEESNWPVLDVAESTAIVGGSCEELTGERRMHAPPATDLGEELAGHAPDIEWLRGTSQLFELTAGTIAWRANATLGLRF